MRFLSVAGTAAMFLVGGGILVHGVPALNHAIEQFAIGVQGPASLVAAVLPTLIAGLLGVVAGAVVLAGVALTGKARAALKAQ